MKASRLCVDCCPSPRPSSSIAKLHPRRSLVRSSKLILWSLRCLVLGKFCRNGLLALLEELLQVVEHVLLRPLARDKGSGHALAPCAARAPDAVGVGVDRGGEVVLDHVLDALNVDSAAHHIRGHEHVRLPTLEGLQGGLALVLRLAAMDGGGRIARLVECLLDVVGRVLLVDKDNDGRGRARLDELEELVHFAVLLGEEDVLGDVVPARALVSDVHIGWAAQVAPRNLLHRGGHGGAEHEGLAVRLALRQHRILFRGLVRVLRHAVEDGSEL
mmetsp:Transcript_2014/g.5632  ORF Transcript_2014/g.5632 Transcript_2014/m.5632 type:complete len:273 (+) Transcript_2014:363-1181(+)